MPRALRNRGPIGTHRNAIRVYPTPDDLANRCELRVLDHDPHADAVPWLGPSVTSITQPIDMGPFEDAEPCRMVILRRHAIIGGATGSGKAAGSTNCSPALRPCVQLDKLRQARHARGSCQAAAAVREGTCTDQDTGRMAALRPPSSSSRADISTARPGR